ncbi:hypothetical protein Y032_0006g2853 [Ancylostoma ceylanicum]|uniref:Uncharacterized protein n=1 Tax=Ancylostoma ceylanicum TaxID=53326 RepID=A0A016VPH7_9BILA|nr:hypothetical protein Y032_0006g2853 [Ancylostoma ceylanicum]
MFSSTERRRTTLTYGRFQRRSPTTGRQRIASIAVARLLSFTQRPCQHYPHPYHSSAAWLILFFLKASYLPPL